MKELGLQELLRYALSGGIAIAVLVLTYPEAACSIGRVEGAKEITVVLGSILLIGTVVYNIHRALLFPPFFRLVSRKTLEQNPPKRVRSPWKPSDAELEADNWRWNLTEEKQRRWAEWGAQTHSLYCAAWAIATALLVGLLVYERLNLKAFVAFWVLCLITLVAGIVNNYRLLYSISVEMKRPPSPGTTGLIQQPTTPLKANL